MVLWPGGQLQGSMQDVPAHAKAVVPAWTSPDVVSTRQCSTTKYRPKQAIAAYGRYSISSNESAAPLINV